MTATKIESRLTARNLELYSEAPTAEVAALEINAALVTARTALRRARLKSVAQAAKLIGRLYGETVYPVLEKHKVAGACDSEPRYHATQALVDEAKRILDITSYCPELADYV